MMKTLRNLPQVRFDSSDKAVFIDGLQEAAKEWVEYHEKEFESQEAYFDKYVNSAITAWIKHFFDLEDE